MIIVKEETAGAAWLASLEPFLRDDHLLLDGGAIGGAYMEEQNVIMTVSSPSVEPVVSELYAYPDLLKGYGLSARTTSMEARELYERIWRWESADGTIDQFNFVVRVLKRNPNSRRAVIALWNPAKDIDLSHAVCPALFQLAIRPSAKGRALTATLIVRSSDAWVGAPLDMFAFTRLQGRIAERLDVEIGEYVHHAVSYHLYQQYVPAVVLMVRQGLAQ